MIKTKLATIALMLFFASVSYAQAPKDGVLIKMDDYELDLSNGSAETKVYFVRSKRLSRVKLDAPVVNSMNGIDVAFEPIASEEDAYKMTVTSTDPLSEPLTLTVDGTGRWVHKIKSASFSVAQN